MNQIIQCLAGDTESSRRGCDGESQRFKTVCSHRQAGMRRIFYGRGPYLTQMRRHFTYQFLFNRWNAEVLTNFPRKQVNNLAMTGDRRAFVLAGIMPPRMTSAFAQQFAAILTKMAKEIAAFHT